MYNIKLFKGYEGKDFIGMSPEEVVKNMPNFEETYFLGENDEIRRTCHGTLSHTTMRIINLV